jgi:hypothetical protein
MRILGAILVLTGLAGVGYTALQYSMDVYHSDAEAMVAARRPPPPYGSAPAADTGPKKHERQEIADIVQEKILRVAVPSTIVVCAGVGMLLFNRRRSGGKR